MALAARDIYASYGEREKANDQMVIVNKKVICNELLSNVLRGIIHCSDYNISDQYMLEILDNVFSPDAVHEARRILYKNFYTLFPADPSDPNEVNIGSKEREIRKKDFLMDIIDKMHTISSIDHDIEFCVPWDYRFIIISDEEKRLRDIVKEKDDEIDAKFGALEKVIELQNHATILAVESVMKKTLSGVVSEAKLERISSPVFEEAEFYKGSKRRADTI